MKNLGTKIEKVTKPIARGIDAIWGSDLAGCRGCNKMRDNLDAGMSITNAVIERWFTIKKQGEKMRFVIQMDVGEVENIDEAILRKGEGTTIGVNPVPLPPGQPKLQRYMLNVAISVMPRPQPPPRPLPQQGTVIQKGN